MAYSEINRPVGEPTFANANLTNKQASMNNMLSPCYREERYRKCPISYLFKVGHCVIFEFMVMLEFVQLHECWTCFSDRNRGI